MQNLIKLGRAVVADNSNLLGYISYFNVTNSLFNGSSYLKFYVYAIPFKTDIGVTGCTYVIIYVITNDSLYYHQCLLVEDMI